MTVSSVPARGLAGTLATKAARSATTAAEGTRVEDSGASSPAAPGPRLHEVSWVRAGPVRPRAGGRHRDQQAPERWSRSTAARRKSWSAVHRHRPHQSPPRPPSSMELTRPPRITAARRARANPRRPSCRRPPLDTALPDDPGPRRRGLRHPRRRARSPLAAASLPGFRSALDRLGIRRGARRRGSPESATEAGAERLPGRLLWRPACLAQWPAAYKQMMVGVFERVYASVRSFGRNHPTPPATSTRNFLGRRARIHQDHTTCSRLLRQAIAGMPQRIGPEAQKAAERLDVRCRGPGGDSGVPVPRRACERQRAAASPTWHPRTSGPGEWAHPDLWATSSRHRLPDGELAVHPPASGAADVQQLDLMFRGLELCGRPAPARPPTTCRRSARGARTRPPRGRPAGLPHGMPRTAVRDRARTLGRPADPCRQDPGGHALPPRTSTA